LGLGVSLTLTNIALTASLHCSLEWGVRFSLFRQKQKPCERFVASSRSLGNSVVAQTDENQTENFPFELAPRLPASPVAAQPNPSAQHGSF
jgi:hypothetical protein